MNWLKQMFIRQRHYDELSETIREHLEEKTADLVDRGMTQEEAERTARREFGNATRIEERSREVWQWHTVESALADVRFALRQLLKAPGFTLTAVLTLALGIAVNGTIYSLVSAWLMPDLPERDANKVVVVSAVKPDGGSSRDVHDVSAANYDTIRNDTHVFAETTASLNGVSGSLGGMHDQPEAIEYSAVAPNYFNIFGAAPELGRGFLDGEDQPGRDHVVVLSHGLWARRFGSDPAIVGRSIRLNREDYTVVGVMGAEFRLMWLTPQLWTPLTLKAADLAPAARRNRNLMVFARLAPSIGLTQAAAEAKRLADRAASDFPEFEGRWSGSVRTLKDYLIRSFDIATSLAVMLTAVGFLLLIACSNVSGLLLTRAAGRQKELAIRASLGASRARIVRQLLIEGLTLALIGGAAGLGLTWVGIRLLRSLLTFNEAIAAVAIDLDGKVLLFAVGLTLLSAVLASLAPAWKASRTDINTHLKNEGRAATAGCGRNRLRAALVGGEIAMALFLVVGTGLLVRGIYALHHQPLGFKTDHLLTAGLVLDAKKYPDAATQARFAADLVERLHQIPGVNDAAVTSDLPSTGAGSVVVHIQGFAEPPISQQRTADHVMVTPEFFAAAGIAALRGRTFTSQDNANTPRVIVVNQLFVERYLGGGDAVGKQIKLETGDGTPAWEQIVGVVANVKHHSELTRIDPMVYEAFAQRPGGEIAMMLRGEAPPDAPIPALRRTVASLDPELPLLHVMSMEEVIEVQRNGDPVFEEILATFSVLALVLAAIGIYGLIAYSVRQRTQEFGIRLALGAKQRDIAGMVFREGLKVTAIASVIGLLLSLPLGRLFDSMFEGIEFVSPVVYPTMLALIVAVAMMATYIPARRAASVDPTSALRNE